MDLTLISSVANPDVHHFGNPGPVLEPHESEKPDPDPHQSQNSVAVKAPNGVLAGL
jgi:hypothetical protein